jgi:glycosyl transferase family 25
MSKNIEKIIYINLERRTDRREHIENELNSFGLEYERFEAIETPGFGILGCGLSHLEVLKLARERSYKNILIIEDDFKFVVNKDEFETQLSNFFDLNINYNVCMLSYNLIDFDETDNNFLLKIKESDTASGYIVNENYYNKLIRLYEWAMPKLKETHSHWIYANDQIWKRYQANDNWVCFKSKIGKQLPGISDTSNGKYCERD